MSRGVHRNLKNFNIPVVLHHISAWKCVYINPYFRKHETDKNITLEITLQWKNLCKIHWECSFEWQKFFDRCMIRNSSFGLPTIVLWNWPVDFFCLKRKHDSSEMCTVSFTGTMNTTQILKNISMNTYSFYVK